MSAIELRSATDELEPLQAKMQEYMDNGVRLGWLINPQDRIVEIYRQGQPKQILEAALYQARMYYLVLCWI